MKTKSLLLSLLFSALAFSQVTPPNAFSISQVTPTTVPTAANPTATISGTVGTFVNGSASTFMRSDAAPTLPATITGFTSLSSALYLAGNGSNSAPSFAFTSTPGTGFYYLNSTNVTFSANGTASLTLGRNPGGNVNYVVGTTSAGSVQLYDSGQIAINAAGGSQSIMLNPTSGGKTIMNTGNVQMSNYGAGAATFDASGNITSASDLRLKHYEGRFTRGLAEIRGVNPITFRWRAETGFDTGQTYSGFSAQNVAAQIPEAAGMNMDGTLTIQDRALLAAVVNAIKELDAKVQELSGIREPRRSHLAELEAKTSALSTSVASRLAEIEARRARDREIATANERAENQRTIARLYELFASK